MNNAQSIPSAPPSPTPMRSGCADMPLDDVTVATFVQSPLFHELLPVLERLLPMHPVTIDSSDFPAYWELSLYST